MNFTKQKMCAGRERREVRMFGVVWGDLGKEGREVRGREVKIRTGKFQSAFDWSVGFSTISSPELCSWPARSNS